MDKETILVVDDNHQAAHLLVHKLLPTFGYQALAAYDGQSALQTVASQPVSLMLLDLNLPDISGLEVINKLYKNGRELPVILVTAHGSEQAAAEAFRMGVKDYLIKPVDGQVLDKAIRRAITESRLGQERTHYTNQLQEQVTWLKELSKIGQSLTASLDLDVVLRRIVEAGVSLTGAEEGFLALLDEVGSQLYLRAVKNMDQKMAETTRLPVVDSMLGTVMNAGSPLRSSRSNPGSPIKIVTGLLVYSLVYIPIMSRGNALGVLGVVNRTKERQFKEIDETLLSSLADYASVAIENANLFERAQVELEERKRLERAMRESEQRYALAVQGANDGLWDWDLQEDRVYYSTRWKSILGYLDHEIGTSPSEWLKRVYPEDLDQLKLDLSAHLRGLTSHFENEHRIRHANGEFRWVLSRGLAVWDPHRNATRMAGSLTDITDRKTAEQKFMHDAVHDALTGLPNRTLFMDRLRQALERTKRREDYIFAVLFLDLDRFKDVNDSLGHLMGDQLLITIAQRLKAGLRSMDTVARLGGDEFVILLEDIQDVNNTTRIADWVLGELTSSFMLDGHEVFVSTSIGIVLSVTGYNQPEEVLRDADIAMYNAKAKGKSRYEIFDPAMRQTIVERLQLEGELRQALDRQELRLLFQPIVSLQNGRLVGFEALLRWQHPARGLLPPAEFLPLAEESGSIIAIDRWVLRTACRQMKGWQQRLVTEPPLSISVNLSGKHFTHPDLVEYVQEVLEDTGLDPCSLKIEITENTILENDQATFEILKELQSLGIDIQIDDFGIGYSSLSYLSNFPINALKIDRSFIGKIADDSNHLKIVQAIVMLTRRLKVGLIAEGVETESQLSRLRALGCDFGQGYLVSKPLDDQQMEALLDEGIESESLFPRWKGLWQTA